MERPDPYGEWVLHQTPDPNDSTAIAANERLVLAARDVWPRVLAHARIELRGKTSESEVEALFKEAKQKEDALLSHDKYSDRVGAFEGADYEAHGYYRPQENCIMFTRYETFCAVCRRAIQRIIAMYAAN